jgi:hypothetical protein
MKWNPLDTIYMNTLPNNVYGQKMISGEKVKQILYTTIDEIGKETIKADISSNIESSQKYIDSILSRCITRLTSELNGNVNDIITGTLCEALLHFMLTISTLPSERKVAVREDLTIDVVIPSLAGLRRDTNSSIIIQIIKDMKADLNNIEDLELLQPNPQNVWLITSRPLSIAKHVDYTMFSDNVSRNYSNIITDIDRFLRDVKDKSFRFVH